MSAARYGEESVGWAKARAKRTSLANRRAQRRAHAHSGAMMSPMSRYRRAKIEGGVFFFTVALADRTSDLLVRHVDRLRRMYQSVQERHPFETITICILPDHVHAAWSLPAGDADFPLRWSLIKSGFSRGLAHEPVGWVEHLRDPTIRATTSGPTS